MSLVELSPNRLLLNSKFDGYKLSLKELPIVRQGLTIYVDKILLNPEQYSILHAKLFCLHNYLHEDPFDNNSVYFIDKDWNVKKISLGSDNVIELVSVWQIPQNKERSAGNYNVSMKFVSTTIAVIGDGAGLLHILETGNRTNDDLFSPSFSDKVLENGEAFVIMDAVLANTDDIPELHVLLLSLKQENTNERFITVLYWITLTYKDRKWGQSALKEIKCKGSIDYAALERSCNAVYLVSGAECKFVLNSDCPVTAVDDVNSSSGNKKVYKWSQDNEEITINIFLPENPKKELVTVHSQPTQIEVCYNSNVLVKGPLHQNIDSSMTNWTLSHNQLEINLYKQENGLIWPELVTGDEKGEQVLDPHSVDEVHEKLAHLCSDDEALSQSGTTFNSEQIEECDFESDESSTFVRLNGCTNQMTHKVNLGSHQVLLTVRLNKDLPLAMGIRHDVDMCLWQPQGRGDDFSITHEGTLLAMSYVQASKENRKFTVCPPNMSYSAISLTSGHIFIYKQEKAVESGELRHRATGRRIDTIAEQQVVNISNNDILGIHASNSALYILTENSIIVVLV